MSGATCRRWNGTCATTPCAAAATRATRSARPRWKRCAPARTESGPNRDRRMKLWSIEGNSQRLDGGSMFGNAPRAMWARWMAPAERNRIRLAPRATRATPPTGKTVLFESGIGAFFDPNLRERFGVAESHHVLLDSLREAGFEHTDIDVVVLSHLHFDHAGGLLAPWAAGREPELLFPNATFVIGRQHWQRACRPHARDRASFIPELPG